MQSVIDRLVVTFYTTEVLSWHLSHVNITGIKKQTASVNAACSRFIGASLLKRAPRCSQTRG